MAAATWIRRYFLCITPAAAAPFTINAKEDALVGIYYQAAIGQSFEVAFFRK